MSTKCFLSPRKSNKWRVKAVIRPPSGVHSIPKIKITRASESRLEVESNKLTACQLDLELETWVTDEYIMHQFESQIRDQLTDMSSQMWALTQHAIEHRELSPFQSHSIIKRRGEIIVELQCQLVTIQAVLGERREDKCSKNALPVYLASNTRLINDRLEVEFDACDHSVPPA